MPPNPQNLKPFVKGDPRINRKGRPKSFDALRTLAQDIAHEKAKAGGNTVVIDGHSVTVAEAILRQWAQSKNPALQQKFIEGIDSMLALDMLVARLCRPGKE